MKDFNIRKIIPFAIKEFKRRNSKWPTPQQLKEFIADETGWIAIGCGIEPWQNLVNPFIEHFKNGEPYPED